MHLFEVQGSDETGSQFSSNYSITKNLTNIIIVLNASVIVHHRCVSRYHYHVRLFLSTGPGWVQEVNVGSLVTL